MTVPKELTKELADAAEQLLEDREGMWYAMAFRVIRYFLGAEWAEHKVRLQEQSDPFMLNEFDEESENRFTHQNRVASLGHYLYCLQESQNFDVLLKRFSSRPTKPCFLESQIASYFFEDGFHIEIIDETGTRGSDFDFIARKDGCQINVEVTAKDDVPISTSTIRNTLFGKRNQLPDDNPSVLCVIVPTAWTDDGSLAEEIIQEATSAFFARSKRINVVVFFWERSFELDGGRLIVTAFRSYFNPHPRHSINNLSFLKPRHEITDLHMLQHILDSGSNVEGLKEQFSRGELAWVPSYAREL